MNLILLSILQSKQWAGNDPIPDVVEKYRAPMLHWVATFGNISTLSLLVCVCV